MPGTSLGFRSVEGKENLADPAPTVSLAFCENTFRAKSARRGEEISQSIGNARDIIGFPICRGEGEPGRPGPNGISRLLREYVPSEIGPTRRRNLAKHRQCPGHHWFSLSSQYRG